MVDTNPDNSTLFHIEVLHLIHSRQLQHGLRHGNFQRYRRFCRDAIHRMRKSLKTTKRSKYGFQKMVLTSEMITDPKHLMIPLFCAERCWAHANEIKNLPEQYPKRQHHVLKKLKRCCKHASHFCELVENTKCDNITKWEAKAYNFWALSTYQLFLKSWKDAINSILHAKNTYETILNVSRSEAKLIYQNRIDELSVNEKYCLYNLKGERNAEELNQIYSEIQADLIKVQLTDELNETRRTVENVIEIEWKNQKYFVQTYKAKDILISMRDKNPRLSHQNGDSIDSKLEIFDQYLIQCKEAIQEIQTIMNSTTKPTYIDERYSSQRDLQQIQSYLSYLKHSLAFERNLVIFKDLFSKYNARADLEEKEVSKTLVKRSDSVRPEQFIRILDQLIQDSNDIISLINDPNDAVTKNYAWGINFYNACRCYFGSMFMQSEKRLKDAVCLSYISLKYFDSAKSVESPNIPDVSTFVNLMASLEERCRSFKIDLDVLFLTDNINTDEPSKPRTIYDSLHETIIGQDILNVPMIDIPSSIISIPADPIIKDNAFSYITWPDIYIDTDIQKTTEDNPHSVPSSIATYLKSWIWKS